MPILIEKDDESGPPVAMDNSKRRHWLFPWMVYRSVLDDESLASGVDEVYPDPEATGPSLVLPFLATLLREGQHASLRVWVEKHLEKGRPNYGNITDAMAATSERDERWLVRGCSSDCPLRPDRVATADQEVMRLLSQRAMYA